MRRRKGQRQDYQAVFISQNLPSVDIKKYQYGHTQCQDHSFFRDESEVIREYFPVQHVGVIQYHVAVLQAGKQHEFQRFLAGFYSGKIIWKIQGCGCSPE